MSTCGACGSRAAASLPLRGDAARSTRLPHKLLRAARLELPSDEHICFRCVYKIEDHCEWLDQVSDYQFKQTEERRNKPSKKNKSTTLKQTKQFRETYIKENVWKENLTFNFSFVDDDNDETSDEIIPNAQPYSSKSEQSKNHFRSNVANNGCHIEGDPRHYRERIDKSCNDKVSSNLANEVYSPKFSFLQSEIPENPNAYHKDNIEEKKPEKGNKIKDYLTFSFLSQFNSPNVRPKEQQDSPIQNNMRDISYGDWNLVKTTKKNVLEQSMSVRHQDKLMNYPKASNDAPFHRRVVGHKATTHLPYAGKKRPKKGHESLDLFASQSEDCSNSKEAGPMDWQLTPDEDLIKRVRAKLQNKKCITTKNM